MRKLLFPLRSASFVGRRNLRIISKPTVRRNKATPSPISDSSSSSPSIISASNSTGEAMFELDPNMDIEAQLKAYMESEEFKELEAKYNAMEGGEEIDNLQAGEVDDVDNEAEFEVPKKVHGYSHPISPMHIPRMPIASSSEGSDQSNVRQVHGKVVTDENGVSSVETVAKSWSWVPPRHANNQGTTVDSSIPVRKGALLTADEILSALERSGGIDIKKVQLKQPLDTINFFVVVSGTSTRHLRKMSDVIVRALKERELKMALGITGAEGQDDDDWLVVDCFDSAVHFMLPDTRRALKLEEHWTSDDRPEALPSSHPDHDAHYERLLEQYPIDDEYHRRNCQGTSGAVGHVRDHQNNAVNPKARKPLTFDKETGGKIKNFGTHIRREFCSVSSSQVQYSSCVRDFIMQYVRPYVDSR